MSLKKIIGFTKMLLYLLIFVFYADISFLYSLPLQQEYTKKDQYQIGPTERLLITVHIFGEVRIPGEYLVPDDTNLLELISKAGGPTEYSNLSNVKITRGWLQVQTIGKRTTDRKSKSNRSNIIKKQVIKIDLKKVLDKEKYNKQLPVLQPGDVVRVGRNAWFTWQAIVRVVSQLAIVAQVWYWYSRVE